jgi:hypothetical protein
MCENRTKPIEPQIEIVEIYSNNLEYKTDSLAKRAIIYGDQNAYHMLTSYYYFHMNKSKDLYFYAYQMATIHHHGKAYFDLYHILTLKEKNVKLDSCTYYMALFYLLKAHENGGSVENYLIAKFGNNKIPSSKSYRKKFCY